MRYWVSGFLATAIAAAISIFGDDVGPATVVVPLATLLILCAVFFAAGIVRHLALPALVHSVTARSAGVETNDSGSEYLKN